jgi:hypothetical protein
MRGLVMSLVCIFHDRAQIVHAKTLEYILIQSGLDPWLADSASMGNWRHDVERALGRADCLGAIVIWSESSLSNNIVVEEAELCVKVGRKLVAVLVDNVEPPIGLRWTARVSLIGWKGQREGEDLRA